MTLRRRLPPHGFILILLLLVGWAASPGVSGAQIPRGPVSPEGSGAPEAPVNLGDEATSRAEALSRHYIQARIRYLEELQSLQSREIALLAGRSLHPSGTAAPSETASKASSADDPDLVAPPKVGLWQQIIQGKNIFITVWRLQIITLGGEPVTVGKIVLGLCFLIVGIALAGRITREFRRRAIERMKVNVNAKMAFEKAFFYGYVVFVILYSLQIVSIPLSIFAFLGGAVALAFGFGAQNILNNFISGWILMVERPIRIGDLIDIDGQHGSVEAIGARCTRVRLFTGIHILVPNSALLEKNVVNWTLSDNTVRVSVSVGVAYGSPTRTVEALIRKAVEEHEKILPEPAPVILFEEFGDNSLNFEAHFWVTVGPAMDGRRIRSEVRYRIDELFREANITIAFPQRDIHLDTLTPLQIRVMRDGEKSEGDAASGPPSGGACS